MERSLLPRTLKARSVLDLFDGSLLLAATSPRVAGMSLLGIGPVAGLSLVLWYGAVENAWDTSSELGLAFLCALATLWRYVPAGAAARMVVDGLAGREVGPREALGEAVRRAPSLMAAGALVLWVAVLSLPLALVPLFTWSGAFLAAPLVMERTCAPWAIVRGGRLLLGARSAHATLLTGMWLGGVVVLSLNLWAAVAYGLWLARALFDVETGYLSQLLSPSNSMFLPTLGALSLCLLEPVRQASMALLFVDARVRRDGLDIARAVDTLVPRTPIRRHVAAFLLLALVPSAASAGEGRDRLLRAAVAAMAEGVPVDTGRLESLLDELDPGYDPALVPLAERIEARLAVADHEAAERAFQLALGEMQIVFERGPPLSQSEPAMRALAEAVLARPEFQRYERERLATVEEAPENSWWDRLFARLQAWLEEVFGKEKQTDPPGGPALRLPFTLLWGVVLAVFTVVVAIAVVRALGARGETEAGEDEAPEARPLSAPLTGVLADAVARAPDDWLAEADRLALAGAHREALRAAYLALLSSLHRARAIDYRRTRTNRDLVRSFTGRAAARSLFATLTRRFESAWYGMRGVSAEDFHRAREDALSVVRDRHEASSG